MLQARLLDAKSGEPNRIFRKFPARIGRHPSSDFVLEQPGVWDQHLAITFQPGEGFLIRVVPPALALINDQPLTEARLKNGDVVKAGSSTLQFWLAPLEQRSLRLREALTWAGLALPALVQIYLVYWLIYLTTFSV